MLGLGETFCLCHMYSPACYKCSACIYRQHSKKARELWWQGLPPSVRGKVWKLAIGNDLHITRGMLPLILNKLVLDNNIKHDMVFHHQIKDRDTTIFDKL